MSDLAAYERRFRRAGLPLFIEDTSAREDVWTRAAPLLALVFVGELLGAIDSTAPARQPRRRAWRPCDPLGAFGLLNARGRPPLAARAVGNAELVALLIPAALPLIFGGQVRSALVTAGANLLLLAVVYGVIAFGLLAIVRWAALRLFAQLGAAPERALAGCAAAALFALVLFINTEMWQVFSELPEGSSRWWAGLFVAAGSVFVLVRLPREVTGSSATPAAPSRRSAAASGPTSGSSCSSARRSRSSL